MEIVERSHIGKVRSGNQDFASSFLSPDGKVLGLVCDGMGGHSAGDVASKMAAVHFGHAWTQLSLQDDELEKWLTRQLQKENDRILEKSKKFNGLDGMGTTIVGVAEKISSWLIFNIGDSRAYRFSMNTLKQITQDHSFVNELVLSGEITPEEAQTHPKKNILTRSLGVDSATDPDFYEIKRDTGDILMLCSDGLTNMVSDDQIRNILNSQETLEQKADRLLEEALEAGGTDNISVLLIGSDEEGGTKG